MSRMPTFIVPGFRKCGTTVLWFNLNTHPDIFMGKNPEDPKKTSTEIRFWNNGDPYRVWEKGFDWYKSLFKGNVCGEKCADYVYDSGVMKRIAKHVPDIKLIICLRDPVDRAYSDLQMQLIRKDGEPGTPAALPDHMIRQGLYWKTLTSNILPYFSRENLHFCIQERMVADTEDEMNKIFAFLGVRPFHPGVRDITFEEKDQTFSEFKRWRTPYSEVPSSLRSSLTSFFNADYTELKSFLGDDLEEWRI